MALNITHAAWEPPDHFEAIGFDDARPGDLVRYDHCGKLGWQVWRNGEPVAVTVNQVPPAVLERWNQLSPHAAQGSRPDGP
jgi:hypothetical protein